MQNNISPAINIPSAYESMVREKMIPKKMGPNI